MRTATRVVLAMLLTGIGVAGWIYMAGRPNAFGLTSTPSLPISKLLIGYGTTVAGVVLGTVYRELALLKAAGAKTVPKRFLAQLVKNVELWMGLCASPLVFALLLQSIASMGTAGLVVLALENGFCCTVVAAAIIAKNAGDLGGATPGVIKATGPTT